MGRKKSSFCGAFNLFEFDNERVLKNNLLSSSPKKRKMPHRARIPGNPFHRKRHFSIRPEPMLPSVILFPYLTITLLMHPFRTASDAFFPLGLFERNAPLLMSICHNHANRLLIYVPPHTMCGRSCISCWGMQHFEKKWFKNGFPWWCTGCHSPQHQGMEDTAGSKRIQKQLETSKIRDLATAIDGTKIKCLFRFALRRRFLHSSQAGPHETRWSCAIERSW